MKIELFMNATRIEIRKDKQGEQDIMYLNPYAANEQAQHDYDTRPQEGCCGA